jgi:phage terminase small subunit
MDVEVKLTTKEKMFCHEFVKDFNASRAARDSGYSKNTCAEIGYENLRKPHIKKYIADLLEATEMQAGEIKKRFSNIARTDMKDYLVKRSVPHTPQVKVGLEAVIQGHLDHIRREEEFRDEKGLTEEAFDKFNEGLEYYRDQIIRLRIEFRDNPAAFRIVDGETEMIEIAELDLVKVVDDKEYGIIKSIKHTKDGISIEPYSADNALTTLAKFKGMLVDKSEVDLTVDTVVKVGYGNSDKGA